MAVLPANNVAAAPVLTLDQNTGPFQTPITINGSGFSATATWVSITFGSTAPFMQQVSPPQTIPVTAGNFSAKFVVPNFPRNTYTVTATSNAANDTALTQFAVTSSIKIDSLLGQVGSQVSISGNGFSAKAVLTGYFDNSTAGTTTAGDNGSFSTLTLTVPESPQGSHSIKIGDGTGFSPPLSFTVSPKIMISPLTALVGEQIVVSGKGFSVSSPMTFTLDTAPIVASVRTGITGSFAETPVVVPAATSGNHLLKATDGGNSKDSAPLIVGAALKIVPQSGTSRTAITLTGSGFGLAKAIAVTFNGISVVTVPASVTSDVNGNFTATINALTTPAGTFVIAASDGVNASSSNFTIASTSSPVQNKGPVGASMPISGNGFNSGAAVIIKHDNQQLASTVADNSGAFAVNITIPPSPPGDFKVIASDGVNSVSFNIAVTPSAKTSIASGYVGTEIVVSGSAFPPSGKITINYDSSAVAGTTADANGSFSVSFKAPASKGGTHIIEATDGVNSITSNFAMDSTSPTAPALISPPQDVKAEATVTFQWSPITDPSGVSYTLQLAQDSSFTALLLEKSGLSGSSYQLTDKEKLVTAGKDKPYYWRVKAVDGASNSSPWSVPQSFEVGFILPSWIWYAAISVGAILIFLFGLIIGRRLEMLRNAAKTEEQTEGPDEAAKKDDKAPGSQ
jgi:hypothetical protein